MLGDALSKDESESNEDKEHDSSSVMREQGLCLRTRRNGKRSCGGPAR